MELNKHTLKFIWKKMGPIIVKNSWRNQVSANSSQKLIGQWYLAQIPSRIIALSWWRSLHNSVKLWAMQGHPIWMSHSREFWQTMIHLRREWQTTLVYLPRDPHEWYKRRKDTTPKDESPRSEGVKYATGEKWRITNSPRIN